MIDFTKEICLKSCGAVLRPWRDGDESLIVDSVTDPLIWRFTTEAIKSKDDIKQYVARAISDRESATRYSFAIHLDDSNEIVGSSSFGNISKKDSRVEIGWTWLAPEYHGKGLNSVVKHMLMKYAFECLGAHRVEFKTDNSNPRSCYALEKVGAKREAVLRSHTLMHDGRYRDTAFFSVLEDEWQSVDTTLQSLNEIKGIES